MSKRLSITQIVSYGIGSSPSPLLTNALNFYLQMYMLEVLKVDPWFVSFLVLSQRIWDALTDPIIGYFVLKTKNFRGGIRLWLILSCPFVALTYVLFFLSILDAKSYYYCMLLVFTTFLTAYHVPYTSLIMKMTSDPNSIDRLSTARMLNEAIMTLVGLFVFSSFVQNGRRANHCGIANGNNVDSPVLIQAEKDNYTYGATTIAVISLVSGIICSLMTREKDPKAIETNVSETSSVIDKNYIAHVKEALSFKPYYLLMFAHLFCSMGIQLVQINFPLFLTYSLKMPGEIKQALMTIMVVSVLFLPIAHLVMKKIGKRITYIIAICTMLPVLLWSVFMPEKLNPYVFYSTWVITGISIGFIFLLPWSMLPDTVANFEHVKGFDNCPVFYSYFVFFTKLSVGISMSISSLSLQYAGYDQEKLCDMPESVGKILRYMTGPLSMVFMCLSLVFLFLYPKNIRSEII